MPDKLCTPKDIQPLFLAENIDLHYPDAYICRFHHATFSNSGDAMVHIELINAGAERRNGGRQVWSSPLDKS